MLSMKCDGLQVFNSRMCQLVLGAGAMQVSGLRSITAKHLALSSQCLSACMALHPLLKPLLTATLPTPRLGLILPEFDRLLQVGFHLNNRPMFLSQGKRGYVVQVLFLSNNTTHPLQADACQTL